MTKKIDTEINQKESNQTEIKKDSSNQNDTATQELNQNTIEKHPLKPFLPHNAKILMLGSFPPQKKRWSIEFFYPNIINDMWRIMGLLFYNDKERFVCNEDDVTENNSKSSESSKSTVENNGKIAKKSKKTKLKKTFDKDKIVSFCNEVGIAMFDTACEVIRLKNNAADSHLKVIKETNIEALLDKIPECQAIITTGGKASEVLSTKFGCNIPKIGEWTPINIKDRTLKFFRLPSSSRAYPLKLEKKAEYYKRMFQEVGASL